MKKYLSFHTAAIALSIVTSLFSASSHAAWQKVLSCQDQLVVDKSTYTYRGQTAETRQLVLRNRDAVRHFESRKAIPSRALNQYGEFVYGGISANGYDDRRFQSACDPEINICYVIRQIGHDSFRLEAWRTAYSAFGPQGLVADWVFHGCYLSQNY